MPALATVAADLLGRPLPVLCLDTCELLLAVQCLPQRRAPHVEALRLIHDALTSDPARLWVVVTDLVLHEWGQNIAEVQQKAGQFLVQADKDSKVIHDAWTHLGRPLGSSPSDHTLTTLVHELTALAQEVLARATVLN
jgi:hypothetical protein